MERRNAGMVRVLQEWEQREVRCCHQSACGGLCDGVFVGFVCAYLLFSAVCGLL